MRLDGAAIVSADNRIAVTAGWIIGVHRDRRKSKGEVRVGDSARRRKPPQEIADLVGTGRLWVARGEFEILESDAKRHAKGVTMRLVIGDLLMYVVSLTPLELAGKGSMRWAFRALFVPTDVQLGRLPVEELTRPGTSTLEERVAFPPFHRQPPPAPAVQPQPAVEAKPAPAVMKPPNITPLSAPLITPQEPVGSAAMFAPPPPMSTDDLDLELEFDDADADGIVISEESTEKTALLAYLQSLAYPEEN